jgi:hypothetical protein
MTTPTCLTSLIGLRTDSTPTEIYCINDYPGFSSKVLDDVILALKEPDLTKEIWIERLRDLATNTLTTELINFMPNYKPIIRKQSYGYRTKSTQVYPVDGLWKGIFVKINNQPNITITLKGILLNASETVNPITIQVIDLFTGTVLENISVNTNSQEYTDINIQLDALGNAEVFIAFQDNTITPFAVTLPPPADCLPCRVHQNNRDNNSVINVSSGHFSGSISLSNDLIVDNHTHGLILDFHISCKITSILCDYKSHLALPLLYKTLALISTEINHLIKSNYLSYDENYEEIRSNFEKKYVDGLRAVGSNIHTGHDHCFEVVPRVMNVVRVP